MTPRFTRRHDGGASEISVENSDILPSFKRPSAMPYWIYITTNPGRTVLYTGVTNNLHRRMEEHFSNRGKPETFAGKNHCHQLLHFEEYDRPRDAIAREKEIKAWGRRKKLALIRQSNPDMKSLNKP
jgi:putative endonuclease